MNLEIITKLFKQNLNKFRIFKKEKWVDMPNLQPTTRLGRPHGPQWGGPTEMKWDR
jgi:hypothetical protein